MALKSYRRRYFDTHQNQSAKSGCESQNNTTSICEFDSLLIKIRALGTHTLNLVFCCPRMGGFLEI